MKNNKLLYINFMILMIGLGCSDAVRGVFAPVFQNHFSLDTKKLSMIITISYIGNLVFMLLGSRLADLFGIRRVFALGIGGWLLALTIYMFTDNYYALLIGVFIAMGTSTVLNMLLNIMTPLLFVAPGMIINTLFFSQGIGTTFTQSVVGGMVSSFSHWKLVNGILAVMGIVSLILFLLFTRGDERLNIPKVEETKEKVGFAQVFKVPAFWFFVLIFGFYFVGEHGVMNWMNIYSIEALEMSPQKAAIFPALFFGGVTIGRFLIAPLVGKLGIKKSLTLFLCLGSGFYIVAFLIKGVAFYLLILAGLCLSIVYPTMTMYIQSFFPREIIATATGVILSFATIFDIIFNAIFGTVIEQIGYGKGMMILPISMLICSIIYVVFQSRFSKTI